MVHASLLWNQRALLHHVDFESDLGQERAWAMMGMGPEQRQRMQDYWVELFRHLANFTSMNQTLIDHVRNTMRHYEGTDFAHEEARRRTGLADAPVTRFVKDLRNYITHNATPPQQFQMRFEKGGRFRYAALLKVDDLAKWDRWSAGGRRYLEAFEELHVAGPVQEYAALREVYYSWLFDQFDMVHGDELRDHDAMVIEQQRLRAEADEERSAH
jgi:hypothetical protein